MFLAFQISVHGIPQCTGSFSMYDAKANKTGAGKIRMSKSATISPEINLIGKTTDEAIALLDKYLDDAYLSHLGSGFVCFGTGHHRGILVDQDQVIDIDKRA